MKRFHLHMGVEDLDESIRFYTALFGAPPVKTKPDYAKWMLDDPCINFAISTRATKGVDHLGIQAEGEDELAELRGRIQAGHLPVVNEGTKVCCYALSDKSWIQDPSGLPWETYRTMEDAHLFSDSSESSEGTCCTPLTMATPNCCEPSDTTAGCCD